MFQLLLVMGSFLTLVHIDMFSISSCTATIRLVHNGGHIRKMLQLSVHLKLCDLEECAL